MSKYYLSGSAYGPLRYRISRLSLAIILFFEISDTIYSISESLATSANFFSELILINFPRTLTFSLNASISRPLTNIRIGKVDLIVLLND